MARMRKKFRKFPTPKYARSKNNINAAAVINPRLRAAKINEKVKSKVKKARIKNRGTAPKVWGSVK